PILMKGRRQVGFLESMIGPYLDTHKDRLAEGARFTHMSEFERDEILRRARRLARVASSNLKEVSRRVGRKLGRSAEAVRYTIRDFVRHHPEQALFPGVNGPLDAA